ncbi:PaaX family transcriptional regulator C-terminal domain-containing protein [Uniformispora flossi]|uniref:PaaX family transcriptional regulator n=1 Tax=Uniformispora flossi TaxID=3390723 RepID=UPI003C2E5D49
MTTAPRTRRRSDGSPSARTLLLTVLGEYVGYAGRDRVWSAAVVDALKACGVEETAARRAITRLTHEGWLETEPAGRFTVLVMRPRLVRLLHSWTARLRRAMEEELPWEGTWQQLLLRIPAAARTERTAVEEQLAFQGFGALGQGVWIAADPGGVGALRELVAELGLAGHATWLTCRAGGAGADAALAAQAWDLSAVAPLHVDFLARFGGAVVPPAGGWSDEEAFVLRTRLVHAWRLTFERDPRLPDVLLPEGWPGREATALFVRAWRSCHEAADRWWERLDRDPRGAGAGVAARA